MPTSILKKQTDGRRRATRAVKRKRRELMDPRMWHTVAAVSGIVAVGLGAYGAHGFKPKDPAYKQVWQTASLYHLAHTAALVAAPITNHPNTFGGLLTAGILLFSGTFIVVTQKLLEWWVARGLGACVSVAHLEDRKYSSLAPLGGFAFMGAWATLLF